MNSQFLIRFKDKIKENFDLTPFSTLKIVSSARYYLELSSKQELLDFFKLVAEHRFKYFILGGGSNIAFTKDHYDMVFIRNRYIFKEVIEENNDFSLLKISSGYPISLIVKETIQEGLSGFEYHMGLPGSLGGAIYMNSKWTKPVSYIGDNLVSSEIITKKGVLKNVAASYFNFSYGYSALQDTKDFFLSGVFKLKKEDPEVLKRIAEASLVYRKETQPYGVSTGGCFFKNIEEIDRLNNNLPTSSAGYLIDKCGLKNYRVGNFVVSSKHANFIINEGAGHPKDLQKLIKYVKEQVKARFGVELKEEVLKI
jgi:UDP-N-acetylmuramate dehydrogenase